MRQTRGDNQATAEEVLTVFVDLDDLAREKGIERLQHPYLWILQLCEQLTGCNLGRGFHHSILSVTKLSGLNKSQ